MGIPVLGEIERLITEHGSAAILKERIELAKDQYAALERKVSVLQEQNTKLQGEKDRLELDNYKLKEKVGNLEKQIAGAHGELAPEAVEIIKFLATNGGRHTVPQIARAIGVHPTRAEHFLNELTEGDYLYVAYNAMSPTTFSIGDQGMAYAVKHSIV